MSIRPWCKQDVPMLSALVVAAMPAPWTEAIFLDCFKSNYHGWVTEQAGKLCGFVVVLEQMAELHIMNICIEPAMQRQGLARALLRHVIAFAKSKHITAIWLEFRQQNVAAKQLYQTVGFTLVHRRKGYYPGDNAREDALVYKLMLD